MDQEGIVQDSHRQAMDEKNEKEYYVTIRAVVRTTVTATSRSNAMWKAIHNAENGEYDEELDWSAEVGH